MWEKKTGVASYLVCINDAIYKISENVDDPVVLCVYYDDVGKQKLLQDFKESAKVGMLPTGLARQIVNIVTEG